MKKRKLFEILLKEKSNNKISIVIGPRQVGKTTILKALYDELVNNNNGLFLDLDILSNFEKIESFEKLMNTIRLDGYRDDQKKFFYLFLDEFQRYSDLSLIMKNVYDNHKNIKIYATGSSSLTIKSRIQESLAGRKNLHYLYPLDFEEFLWFKEEGIDQFNNMKRLRGENINMGILKDLLKEFMVYGGYPEVVLSKGHSKKVDVLRNIFDVYAKKELVTYLKIENVIGAKKLIEFIAVNNGQKTNYDEAAEKCSIKVYNLKSYLEVLKETFLVFELRPFFTNKSKELVKIPKLYFVDNGVRNFFYNNFNDVDTRNDAGFLFEGYVLGEMIKGGFKNIKFWQDKNKHEVDFVIDLVSSQIPVEVKFKKKLKKNDFAGIRAFLSDYDAKSKYIINLGAQKKINGISLKLPFNFSAYIK